MKKIILENYIERAVIEINGSCNYKCKICPQTTPGRHHSFLKKMNLQTFEIILKQCVDRGVKVINLEGSGEATLNQDLPKYIQLCSDYNVKSYILSNGYLFKDQFMKDCIDAGLSRFRFSVIGYNSEEYKKWMNADNFNIVKENAINAKKYVFETNSNTEIASYHLISNNDNIDYEIEEYKKNWITPTETLSEIWKMHNWAGIYDNEFKRKGEIKTCGRPFAPELTVRAGGFGDKYGAVHPCCQVLGNENDDAILGYMSENTFDEIWNGEKYQDLRKAHITGNYPDYCKNCDFLIDDTDVLVWTNHNRDVYKIPGTDFDLNDFRD
jgi:MoaA/NifB/PqqE/SkfB family radical SAM enzyme